MAPKKREPKEPVESPKLVEQYPDTPPNEDEGDLDGLPNDEVEKVVSMLDKHQKEMEEIERTEKEAVKTKKKKKPSKKKKTTKDIKYGLIDREMFQQLVREKKQSEINLMRYIDLIGVSQLDEPVKKKKTVPRKKHVKKDKK